MSTDRRLYFIRAMYEGLRDAMREDKTVVVIGEDVDRSIIGATRGLIEEFGPERVRNTPISEATFVGACIGASAAGLRPVVDLMVGSFFYVAMDQVANQAAKLPYMSGGQVSLPIVYFTATGPSGSAAAQHSENPHPMLMNVAGLKIVMPSSPCDAKGLMISAIRDPNPVIYLQDAVLGGTRGPVPEEPYSIPIGEAEVKREGEDVTVVAIGALVNRALKVAGEMERDGISVEVVDPRTLVPMDKKTILDSVRKTGRLVVCDNARMTCSAASEIAAFVSEEAFDSLKTAPRRVAWEDVPVPFSPVLEKRVLVDEEKIRAAVESTLATRTRA
ncbi:Transketolase-like protein [Rubrobacter xylanophilus DSM 9941]|uniref:Transketolase-like protein n=1 Tax=Rubrobacter xylanophilus (strain DSM 9941 / JCM 11954 / NBRC 16129 / PRD-1) TaxID=266117 RepID=Q1ARM1_RUBXD|nr:alpha-ketoacid dehydrogenase subunit beta [Rubrobacter xylanophilus]ABG05957.1 Transketolase-like protein [Rubrobacter xylanophilus DSM 9941]